jgi:hypothetical protein
VPYHAFWTYFIFTKGEVTISENFNDILSNSNNQLQYTSLISTCFLLINSCLNPLALFCTSSPFRQHLKRYLTFHCKTNPLLMISHFEKEIEFVTTVFVFFNYNYALCSIQTFRLINYSNDNQNYVSVRQCALIV